jgi:hypothetical protein
MSVDINMFWHGPQLGAIHAACVRSFLRNGHTVIMHCYKRPSDLPDSVRVFDASKIMPLADLHADRATGSVALGSDRYRYRLIAAGFGVYADCDMFCLRPITDAPYIMGAEQDDTVNNAFLKFPADSSLAKALIEATQDYYLIPPWFRSSKRRRFRVLQKFGLGMHVGEHSWGVWGPRLITHYVNEMGLWSDVAPIDRFYPVHPRQTSLLHDPELCITDLVTPRTEAIHLWHKMLGGKTPPKGSPLHEIMTI